jgi:hypothetical protein
MRQNLKVVTQPAGDVKVDGKAGADAPASGEPG